MRYLIYLLITAVFLISSLCAQAETIWDWKRSIGSDKIIRIEKSIISLELDGALLFSNRFSQNAYDLVNKMKKENSAKIILIKLDEIMKKAE